MPRKKQKDNIPASSLPAILFLIGASLSHDRILITSTIPMLIILVSVLGALTSIIIDPINRKLNTIVNLIIAIGSYTFDIAPLWASVLLATATISGLVIVQIQKSKKPMLLKDLESFTPEAIRDEEELEKQLYQYLKAKGYNVKRQPRLSKGLRADLEANECVIELKIIRTREQAQRLVGQLRDYKKYRQCVVALIVDEKEIIKEYKDIIKNLGIQLIVK